MTLKAKIQDDKNTFMSFICWISKECPRWVTVNHFSLSAPFCRSKRKKRKKKLISSSTHFQIARIFLNRHLRSTWFFVGCKYFPIEHFKLYVWMKHDAMKAYFRIIRNFALLICCRTSIQLNICTNCNQFKRSCNERFETKCNQLYNRFNVLNVQDAFSHLFK